MKNRMISFLYDYIERGMIMKTVRHFALALLVLCLALLIASCGCSRVSEPAADSTTASRPAATDPSATTAPEAKLSSEAAVVSCGDFALDVKTLSLTVPNATESYSLADEIAVSDKATWTVSDAQGQTVYENKTVPLNPGDNAFLLHVTAENNTTTTKYTVTIRRRPLYTLTFNTDGGTPIDPLTVEEGSIAEVPNPTRTGYTFVEWNYNLDYPVEKNLKVKASWTPNTDTAYTVEYYLENAAGTGYDKILTEPKTGTTDAPVTAEQKVYAHFTYSPTKSSPNGTVAPDGSLVLKMYYLRDVYTVTFNGNGGTLTEGTATQSVRYGAAAAIPTFARPGYDFAGWDSTAGCDAVEQPLTITAQWTVIDYAITYTLNGGTNSVNNPATYTVEDAIELANPTRNGYSFAGWSDGGVIAKGSTGATTFVASWTPINYTIAYTLNGGTNAQANPATYTIEDEVALADPTRLGYTFNGWSDGGTIAQGSTGEKTFVASWTVIDYAITYTLNGGTNDENNPATYTVEDEIELADPSRVGYTFAGWTEGDAIELGSTGEKTFTANWTPINYAITYNLNGGTNAQANPATYTIEDEVTLADPSRLGYTFNGWSDGGTIAQGSTGEKTFVASWTVIDYAITYTLNGGTNDGNNPATYTVEDEIELAAPTRNGYAFAGWSDGGVIAKGSTGAKTFVASWTPINYTITYTLNGGTNAQANPATYTIEDEVVLADPTRLGYTFNGWTEGDTIELGSTGAKTFTATWTIIRYPINYNLGGAENDENNPATYTVEDEITLAALSKVGYTFNGWSNGGVIAAGSTGEKTFTANWTAINYQITYNLNGGTNSVNNPATYTIEDEVALADPSRLGYTFTGWSNDGTIARGSTGEKSFTASWTINTYTVSYNLNGGSLAGSNPTTYTIVDNVYLLNPTRNCYRFLGWYTASGTKITNLRGNAADLNLTARWECYLTTNGAGEITGVSDYFKNNVTTLEIPSYLNGTVRSIASDAFADCTRLTSIVIPNSVTSIGQGAFRGCSGLVNMTIPFVGGTAGKTSSDTYQYPFGYIFGTTSYTGGTSTKQYYYGSSTSSDTYTYYYIPASLRSVTVTGGEILYGAFYNCSALTSIALPNGATGIGSYAFYNFGPAAVVIPNSVTTIGKNAFKNSGVTSVTIGTGVENVGINAFAYCSGLTSITWNAVNCADCASSSVDYVFRSCSNVTSISVGSGVTSIPAYAFAGCSGLSSVAIGNSVSSIGNSAFNGCSGNFSLVIPNSVATIGNSAFKSSGVTSVTVGAGVENVGINAFAYCSGLTSITWNAVNCADCASSSVDYVFRSCSNVTSISVGNSVETLPAYAFVGCTELTSVSLGNHVTNIGNYAFYNCSGAFSLVIPNSVETIGSYAFSGCSGITEVVIPDSVTTLGSYAFGSCYSLVSVSIGNGVTTVSSDAFWYCTGLVSVSLGNNVETIKSYAFAYCSSLSSITIPASVTAIEYSAFQDCSALSTAYFACPDGWHESGLSGTKDLSDPTQNASTLRTINHLLYRD